MNLELPHRCFNDLSGIEYPELRIHPLTILLR